MFLEKHRSQFELIYTLNVTTIPVWSPHAHRNMESSFPPTCGIQYNWLELV